MIRERERAKDRWKEEKSALTKLSGWPKVKLCSLYRCSETANLFPVSLSGQNRQSMFMFLLSLSICQ